MSGGRGWPAPPAPGQAQAHAWPSPEEVEAALVARLAARNDAKNRTGGGETTAARRHRRLAASAAVVAAWSRGRAGEAGLAPPLLDGRADALVAYVTGEDDEDDGSPPVLDLPASAWPADAAACSSVWTALSLGGRPAIVRGGAASWAASRSWATADGSPHMPSFGASFPAGAGAAKVTDCASRDVRRPSTVPAFVAWWEGGGPAKAPPLLYLKDVQMGQARPPGFLDDAAGVAGLEEDWLGAAAAAVVAERAAAAAAEGAPAAPPAPATPLPPLLPTYRFVYAGPDGAATPVHCDVMRSHAWAANTAGTKRWLLVPPARAAFLFDRAGAAVADWLDGGGVGGEGPPPPWRSAAPPALLFPWLDRARPVEVVQGQGDVVFVPSGWWHSVENVGPSISLNANFLDAACAADAWAHVKAEHVAAAAREADAAAAAAAAARGGDRGNLTPAAAPPLPPVDGTTLAACDGIGLRGFLEVCARAAGRAAGECEAGPPNRAALARAALTAVAAADIVEDALGTVAAGQLGSAAVDELGGEDGLARLAGVVGRARAAAEAARAELSSLGREC